MATTRTYDDACGIARALDVVGSRWAALVVRELLFGPLRFSDLRRSLPGASTNLLTDRLRELEADGVLHRRRLPPPTASTVYELTQWGRALEPVLLALGDWGLTVPRAGRPVVSPASMLLFLRGSASVRPGSDELRIRLVLVDREFAVTAPAAGGPVAITAGPPHGWDASVACSPETLNDLLARTVALRTARRDGRAVVEGDSSALARLVDAVTPA